MTPNIQKCQFVPLSELECFFGEGQFTRLMDELSNCSFTYGDANRTMISVARFKEELAWITDPDGGDAAIDRSNDLNEFLHELELKDAYIDLEN